MEYTWKKLFILLFIANVSIFESVESSRRNSSDIRNEYEILLKEQTQIKGVVQKHEMNRNVKTRIISMDLLTT